MMMESIVPVYAELPGLLLAGLQVAKVLFSGLKLSVLNLVSCMELMQCLNWKKMSAKRYVEFARIQIGSWIIDLRSQTLNFFGRLFVHLQVHMISHRVSIIRIYLYLLTSIRSVWALF